MRKAASRIRSDILNMKPQRDAHGNSSRPDLNGSFQSAFSEVASHAAWPCRRVADAANIRAYVDAARQSAGGNMAVFDDWAQWALAEADRIDPMVSGRFIDGYQHRESE
jgi:hypothetical protein